MKSWPPVFTYYSSAAYFPSEEYGKVFQTWVSHGAKHIVLDHWQIARLPGSRGDYHPKQVQREALAAGLVFADSHALFGEAFDLAQPVPAQRRLNLEERLRELRYAEELGVTTMTFHPGSERFYPEYNLEQLFDLACQSIEELLPHAERHGITICLENNWCRLAAPDVLLRFKARFPDTPFLGFCYDSGHANLMEKGHAFPDSDARAIWEKTPGKIVWEQHALEKMLPHIVNCHLHDNDGRTDQHLFPGQGTVDWIATKELLKKAPRLQVLQSEVSCRSYDAIAQTCDAFQNWLLR